MQNITKATPSNRWWNKWLKAYRENGGFPGETTLQVQRENALRYHSAGATAIAAGLMCAEQYQLHSALILARELSA